MAGPADVAKLARGIMELLRGPYAAAEEQLGALGATMLRSAEKNPEYFATGKPAAPSSDLAELSARHKVRAVDQGGGHADFGQMELQRAKTRTVREAMAQAQMGNDTADFREWARAIKKGQLSPDTELFGINSMLNSQGLGSAKRAYPAAWESILAQPDAANITDTGLSLNNVPRRSANMVGALEKWGDKAGNRLRIDNDQLGPIGGKRRVSEYHDLPLEAKIGLLQSSMYGYTTENANRALAALRQAGLNTQHPRTLALHKEAQQLGVDQGWVPSTDVDKDYFPRLAELMQGISRTSGVPQMVGVDSLRRAAITHDVMTQGLTAGDLASQPYLTNSLARAEGGRIPGNKPGALTQTCSCGG